MGGYRQGTLSRIECGEAQGVPTHFLVLVSLWAVNEGYNLRWLFGGTEEPGGRLSSLPIQRLNEGLAALVGGFMKEIEDLGDKGDKP